MTVTTFNTLRLSNLQRNLVNLKSIAACVMLASVPAGAQEPAAEPQLLAGSAVSLSAVMKADWIQGEAPKTFESGKIYIFECWSTWCGPCIGMIPHVNDLHKKYYDKGLRIYGLSVWEKDKARVQEFVEKKGDKMSYPVAFTGKDSAFEAEWMTAAGAKSIPHAFVVKNGKLLVSTQASRLTDSLVETMLSGDEGTKKAVDTIVAAQTNQGKADKFVSDIYAARSKNDATQMKAIIQELKTLDSAYYRIPILELQALIVGKEWPAAVKKLTEMPASEPKKDFVAMTSMRVAMLSNRQGYPESFMKALVELYTDYVMHNDFPIGPNHFAGLSMLQWQMDDQENAAITAEKGIEAAKNFSQTSDSLVKGFIRFEESVKKGIMPKFSDLTKWRREAKAKEDAEAAE